MSDFSLLALPNIEGIRVLRYIKILGIVLLFGVCLFFILYFVIRYRRWQKNMQQLEHFGKQTDTLAKQLLLQKISTSSGKVKLVLFIEYLEKFVTTKTYANISELLSLHWFTHQEVETLERVLYTDGTLSTKLETKIDKMIKASR